MRIYLTPKEASLLWHALDILESDYSNDECNTETWALDAPIVEKLRTKLARMNKPESP